MPAEGWKKILTLANARDDTTRNKYDTHFDLVVLEKLSS